MTKIKFKKKTSNKEWRKRKGIFILSWKKEFTPSNIPHT